MNKQDDIFVVIDLGSVFIRGLLATKDEMGNIVPIAYEKVPSEEAIQHGEPHNLDMVARKIKIILQELKAGTQKKVDIIGIYIGIDCVSLRSETEIKKRNFGEEAQEITKEIITDIDKEFDALSYPQRSIVYKLPTYYKLNGKLEEDPISVSCKELQAHKTFITVKQQIFNKIKKIVKDKLGLELKGILPMTVLESNICLTTAQKNMGCVYVNIGGGTTSVAIYKNRYLRKFRVIPMGGKNITNDINKNFHLAENEPERIKCESAYAVISSDRSSLVEVLNADGNTKRELPIIDVNRVVYARMREIIQNVMEITKNSDAFHNMEVEYLFNGFGTHINAFTELLDRTVRRYSLNVSMQNFIEKDITEERELEKSALVAMVYHIQEKCNSSNEEKIQQSLFEKENGTKIEKEENHPDTTEKNINKQGKFWDSALIKFFSRDEKTYSEEELLEEEREEDQQANYDDLYGK